MRCVSEFRCEVSRGAGAAPGPPLECHERWLLDDEAGVATLAGLQAGVLMWNAVLHVKVLCAQPACLWGSVPKLEETEIIPARSCLYLAEYAHLRCLSGTAKTVLASCTTQTLQAYRAD